MKGIATTWYVAGGAVVVILLLLRGIPFQLGPDGLTTTVTTTTDTTSTMLPEMPCAALPPPMAPNWCETGTCPPGETCNFLPGIPPFTQNRCACGAPVTTTVTTTATTTSLGPVTCESKYPIPYSQKSCSMRVGCLKTEYCAFIYGGIFGVDRCDCVKGTITTTVGTTTVSTTIPYTTTITPDLWYCCRNTFTGVKTCRLKVCQIFEMAELPGYKTQWSCELNCKTQTTTSTTRTTIPTTSQFTTTSIAGPGCDDLCREMGFPYWDEPYLTEDECFDWGAWYCEIYGGLDHWYFNEPCCCFRCGDIP